MGATTLSDVAEYWAEHTAWKKDEKDARVERRTEEIRTLQVKFGLEVRWIQAWQARVNGVVDLYLPHGKYHVLKSGKRGQYGSMEKLLRTLKVIHADR